MAFVYGTERGCNSPLPERCRPGLSSRSLALTERDATGRASTWRTTASSMGMSLRRFSLQWTRRTWAKPPRNRATPSDDMAGIRRGCRETPAPELAEEVTWHSKRHSSRSGRYARRCSYRRAQGGWTSHGARTTAGHQDRSDQRHCKSAPSEDDVHPHRPQQCRGRAKAGVRAEGAAVGSALADGDGPLPRLRWAPASQLDVGSRHRLEHWSQVPVPPSSRLTGGR